MMDMSMDFFEKQGSEAVKAPEILREELPLQRFVGENLSQAVVEGEVALPGGLREETTVLCAVSYTHLDVYKRQRKRSNSITTAGYRRFASGSTIPIFRWK